MSEIRTAAAELARLLDDGAAPLYVLDEDRRIAYCNAACAQWVGQPAETLLGQQCSYQPPQPLSDPGAAAIGLCPPPQVFSGDVKTALVSIQRSDGRLVQRRGHFLPLGEGQDESAPVIAVLELADCASGACGRDAGEPAAVDVQLHDQLCRFRHETAGRFAPESLIGNNPLILRVRNQILLAARSGSGALVVGPPGSGKLHTAKAIHYNRGGEGLLVPLDCAVLETNVLRMALRTLSAKAAGRPALGTVVLEAIDCMPREAQDDLLELMRPGAPPLCVIATTACELDELVDEGRFCRELACALGTLVIEMPPLAERLDDLPLLAQAMLEEQNATSYRQMAGFAPDALDHLAAYPWPGNLDELAAVVREVHEHAQGSEIAAHELPKRVHWGAEAAGHAARGDEPIVLVDFLSRVEKELITRAMRRAKGNKSKAAKFLGLTRPRLYRRLVQLGFEQPRDAEPRT